MPTMLTNSSAAVLTGEPIPMFDTANVQEADLAEMGQVRRNKEDWNRFIDTCLIEWGRDTTALEDEDFVPPSREIIGLAYDVAMFFLNKGVVPPTRVVPDGEGGISFERTEGELSVSLNINADKSVELLTFDNCRLRERCRLM